jgi:hypothetical protein
MRRGMVATALALLVIVVGLGLRIVLGDQVSNDMGGEAIRPMYIATAPNAEPPPGTTLVASNAVTGAPMCPSSQTPWLVVSFSAGPADGSASPEAAFRKASPAATEFTMYLWSVSQPVQGDDPRIRVFIPIWVVSGDHTFLVVAHRFGPANETNTANAADIWFAYPATFAGCITGAPAPTGFPRR